MKSPNVYLKFLSQDLKNFFRLKPSPRSWHIPFLAGLSVGIPLIIGYFFDEVRLALIASLAGLTILYIPSRGNIFQIMIKMFVCAFGMILSYSFAVLFSFTDWSAVIGFGVITTIFHYVSRYFNIKPPGSFFFIMIASMALGNQHELHLIPRNIGLFSLGAINACLLALLYGYLFLPKSKERKINNSFKINPYTNFAESLIIGVFMMISVLIGRIFNLDYPYWIPISCLAILQAVHRYHIIKRGIHRLLGTIVGLGLVWIIFTFVHDVFWLCICVIILQIIVELLITRHYALTVVFLTPLGVLLAETGSTITSDPNYLLQMRLIEVLIGTGLGVIGGYFLFHEKIKFLDKKHNRQSKSTIKKSNI